MKSLFPAIILAAFTLSSPAADIFVDQSPAGTGNDGSSWFNAFSFLADALDVANAGDEILISEGTYYPGERKGSNDNDSSNTFLIPGGVTLKGGFPSSGGLRNPANFRVILSGDLKQDDVNTDGNDIAESPDDQKGDNALHVVTVSDTGNSTATLDGLTITAGSANVSGGEQTIGGGLFISASQLVARGCRFIGNQSTSDGGGVASFKSAATMINCTFSGNVAEERGGAFATLTDGLPNFINCAFLGNLATNGGALYLEKSAPTVTNCSISGNAALETGGAIELGNSGELSLENTIIWNNHTAGGINGTAISGTPDSDVDFFTCLIQNDGGSDPLFTIPPDPNNAPSSIGDLDIPPTSPAVDAGTDALNVEPFDALGRPRIIDQIDIGAYEGSLGILVDSTATGMNDGTSWADAFTELQDALAVADSGDFVSIAAGVYFPDQGTGQTPDDPSSTFDIGNEVTILGGFPVGGGERDIEANPTILSGDLGQDDLNSDGNHIAEDVSQITGENTTSVLSIAPINRGVTLSGLTITAGDATGNRSGGGIYSFGRDLTLEDLTIIGNRSKNSGAGALCSASPGFLTITGCSFISNTIDGEGFIGGGGGGLRASADRIIIAGSQFQGNSIESSASKYLGIAMTVSGINRSTDLSVKDTTFTRHLHEGTATDRSLIRVLTSGACRFTRCIFSENHCGNTNTSLLLGIGFVPTSAITDCLFSGNVAGTIVAMSTQQNTPATQAVTIINTTIAGNQSLSVGKTEPNIDGTLNLQNCVFDQPLGELTDITLTRTHSLIVGQDALGSGNIDGSTDPKFVSPSPSTLAPTSSGDYRTLSDSPLIDSGLNGATTSTIDLIGSNRFIDGNGSGAATIDIGAYENPDTPDPIPIKITAIAHNRATGLVTLSVDSLADTGYSAQYSADLNFWSPVQTGSLVSGSNTVTIPGNAFGWPQRQAYFRLALP